jgi:UDP-N-acetylglucosamine 2-epimerase (non-hydrolysing)
MDASSRDGPEGHVAQTPWENSARPTVLVCFGTRPEVIKLAPVIERLRASGRVSVVTMTTAQHREMLDQTLANLGLKPDFDLALMRPQQELWSLAGAAIRALGGVFSKVRPDAVVVQGDTTSSFCAAYAAYSAGARVAHVEAGLRSHDRDRPFPEEGNRRLISALASWNFCPTQQAAWNLHREGIAAETIEVTGNTVVDALLALPEPVLAGEALPSRQRPLRILVTLHRRETHGEPQRRLCAMLRRLAERPDVEIVFPVHLSPAVRRTVYGELEGMSHVSLLPPLDYAHFVGLMASSDLVVTDSGGVQEEAPSLNIPVVVMRDVTDRPEGIRAGCSRLAGTDPALVEREVVRLLDDPAERAAMAVVSNPYGDGEAAVRIVDRLLADLLGEADWAASRAGVG